MQILSGKKSGTGTDANGKVFVNHNAGTVPTSIQITDINGTVNAPRVYSVQDVDENSFSIKVAITGDTGGDYHLKPNGGSHPWFYWLVVAPDA